MAARDQALDKRDHGADLLRGLRPEVRILHAGRMHVLDEQARVFLGHFGGRARLLGSAADDLIVHVGHVLHEGDIEAAPDEVAADHVEGDERARVADVDAVVHRRPADVHGDLPRLDRFEVHLLAAARIVQLDHKSSFGRSFRMRAIVAQESTLTFATQAIKARTSAQQANGF